MASSSSAFDAGARPPHPHTHASPLRRAKPPTHAPTTPATAAIQQLREERALHQPSPNRTEAAAAMMHLFASSKTDGSMHSRLPTQPQVPAMKAKRKYVRKAPRKPSAAAKKLAKITESSRDEGEGDDEGDDRAMIDHGSVDGDDDMGESSRSPKENDPEGGADFAPFREYNRKEKSLGLLCENFLKLYRSDEVTEICLDRAATQLGVERRRIYDIVNILESIHLVSRKSKNLYNWHGLGALPVSTIAMKKKYVEMELEAEPGNNSYDYSFKDRRRGKSLSKLSQMFVQLFLKKDNCIIPLDQAAKQLISMEESENEEDRQLKTKIRRLYDVANVLVSVGLIEKMQLSNSRKPVFRWKHRARHTGGDEPSTPGRNDSSLKTHIRIRGGHHSIVKIEPPALDESEPIKTSQSQSGDSDIAEDSSDSQAEEAGSKRKQSSRKAHSRGHEGGNNKRPKTSPTLTTAVAAINERDATGSLLRFNQRNVPIHPQIIYQEHQVQLKQYMEQYIREYIDFVIAQQVRPDQLSLSTDSNSSNEAPATASGDRLVPIRSAKDVAASWAQEIQRTPMSIPSLMTRASSELAGSIQDLLFPSNSTSPQSVADLLPLDSTRAVTKSLQRIELTTPSPRIELPALAPKTPTKPADAPPRRVQVDSPESDCSSSSSSSSASCSGSSGPEDIHLQARRLFNAFQPPIGARTDKRVGSVGESCP